MVDASSLNDYEIWLFIASLICNFLVGFVVSTFTAASPDSLGAYIAFDVLCLVLLVFAIIMTFKKRNKMSIEKKIINLGLKKNS